MLPEQADDMDKHHKTITVERPTGPRIAPEQPVSVGQLVVAKGKSIAKSIGTVAALSLAVLAKYKWAIGGSTVLAVSTHLIVASMMMGVIGDHKPTVAAYSGPGDVTAFWGYWAPNRCYASATNATNIVDVVDAATGNTTGTRMQCNTGGVIAALVSGSACTFVTGNACSALAVTCAVACNIVNIYDQTGNSAGTFTQATNANRPAYITGGSPGGKDIARFTGSQNMTFSISVSKNTPFTMYTTAKSTTTSTVCAIGTDTANSQLGSNATTAGDAFLYGGGANIIELPAANNTWHNLSGDNLGGGLGNLYADGSSSGNLTLINSTWQTTAGFGSAGDSSNKYTGDIGEDLLMATKGLPLRFAGPSGVVNFLQGALGGGGYADGLSGPATTNRIFVRGNYADLYRWKATSQACDNVTTSPHMDNLGIGPQISGTPMATAVAPSDETRVYALLGILPPRLGYQAFGANYAQFYASNDGGDTWYKPGSANPSTDPLTQPFSSTSGNVYSGSNIVVDPLNKDIVWYMDWNGPVWLSYDGAVTWTLQTSLMNSALQKATAAGNSGFDGTAGTNTFKVTSNPILGTTYNGYGIGMYNATHPFSINGQNIGGYVDASSSSTLIALGGVIQGNTGGTSVFGDPGVVNGDTIYFGRSGGICVDTSDGSIANPGGSGVMSKTVYFCWQAGATSLWKTLDGGSTFSVVGSGGPTGVGRKMKISNDAVLGTPGGNNVLWLADGDSNNYYRWVKTPPMGSGLSANTWTTYAGSTIFSVGSACCVLPDPAAKGRVIFIRETVTPNVSNGTYGDTRVGFTDGQLNIGGDTRWMNALPSFDFGDAEFSLATAGRVFLALGTGLYYIDVTNTSALQTANSQMQILQSLIVGQVLKAPSPGNKIVLAWNQDRALVVCDDEHTIPDGYFPQALSQAAGRACYSLNDPTKIFAGEGSRMLQYAGGNTGGVQNWTQITTTGLHGWTGLGDLQPISRSSTELFVVSGGTTPIQYGTLSGGIWSWTNTLFGGNPLNGSVAGKFGNAAKVVDIDTASGIVWYADTAAGTVYKSTDGGATLTSPGGAGAGIGFLQLPGQGAQLAAVPGQTNHLFFANGFDGGGSVTGFTNPGQNNLSFTNDGGANWNHVSGTYYIMQVAVGPAKPGSSYPTIYIFGQLNASNTFQYSVYRCTDFNSATFTGTWVDIGANLKKVECTSWRGGLTADPDNWSKFYMGSSDNGYVVGSSS